MAFGRVNSVGKVVAVHDLLAAVHHHLLGLEVYDLADGELRIDVAGAGHGRLDVVVLLLLEVIAPPGASSKAVRRCWPLVSRFFLLS